MIRRKTDDICMSAQIKIELTQEAQGVVAKLQTLPARIIQSIAAAMNAENLITVSHIQRKHLTGTGPFPPEQHKLGIRTQRLRSSARASDAIITGQTVDSSIGSNVLYAAVHELGGRINKKARDQKIRLRTDARGNLVRQLKNSNLATFARADHKRARETTAHIGAHEIEIPERAPFRTGIQECKQNYAKTISSAMVAAWKKSK